MTMSDFQLLFVVMRMVQKIFLYGLLKSMWHRSMLQNEVGEREWAWGGFPCYKVYFFGLEL